MLCDTRFVCSRLAALAFLSMGVLAGCSDQVGTPTAIRRPSAVEHVTRSTAGVAIIQLPSLGGRKNNVANAVNDSGLVVGEGDGATGVRHAFYWTEATGMHDLGTLGGSAAHLLAVNDAGVAAGYVEHNAGVDFVPITWSRSSGMRALPVPLNWSKCSAVGINRFGNVTGSCWCGGSVGYRAVMWPPNGGLPVNLGALPITSGNPDGLRGSTAGGIDVHTTVVGNSSPGPLPDHSGNNPPLPVIKPLGQPLQRLFPNASRTKYVTASAISPLFGYITGVELDTAINNFEVIPVQRAYLWEGSGTPRALGGPFIIGSSIPNGVNDRRWVVGATDPQEDGAAQAFIWRPDHGMQLLGGLPGANSYAAGLNNRGLIVGYSGQSAVVWVIE